MQNVAPAEGASRQTWLGVKREGLYDCKSKSGGGEAHVVPMEQNHHLCSGQDTDMDSAEDNKHLDRMEMETEETQQHVADRERLFGSCRGTQGRFRPRLLATKSFPPYSQCIGGLGEDEDWDDASNSESNATPHQSNEREDTREEVQDRKPSDMTAKCPREVLRAKWRSRRREKLGGSFDVGTEGWERGRWSGKRRGKESGEGRAEGPNADSKHWRGRSSGFGKETDDDREEEEEEEEGSREASPSAGASEESSISTETSMEMTEPSTQRHPILSKLLLSSSTSSSCSSINLSSGESDEVFSEAEDAAAKRKTFRKSRSWKTFLTMMHWSLRRQSSWVQLAGHQGNFQVSKGGEVLKLYSEPEAKCLDCLMSDSLRPFVPQYHGLVTRGEHCYIRLEDLLNGLRRPVIMDCKMGVRTFQEEELIKARTKPTPRSDMYQKMLKIDPSAPSEEEHEQKGVTKWRYLQWRDTTTSTSTLGFRIEGVMMEDGNVQRDFRKIKTLAQVTEALVYFTRSQLDTLRAYHSRLLDLKDALRNSSFFRTHEVIGSSLLFVHDHHKASVWMIDFGKTTPLPDAWELQHSIPWTEGTREDGYLIGLTSLISSLSDAIDVACRQQEVVCEEENLLHEVL